MHACDLPGIQNIGLALKLYTCSVVFLNMQSPELASHLSTISWQCPPPSLNEIAWKQFALSNQLQRVKQPPTTSTILNEMIHIQITLYQVVNSKINLATFMQSKV